MVSSQYDIGQLGLMPRLAYLSRRRLASLLYDHLERRGFARLRVPCLGVRTGRRALAGELGTSGTGSDPGGGA